jgi:diguanylate cyclase (GGDEF)-like protein
MHRKPSRLAQVFAPLPRVAALAQWRLLESAFAPLRTPPVAIYAPMAGGLAAFSLTQQGWCLAWVLIALGAMVVCQRVAQAFHERTSEHPPTHWARNYASCVYGQAAVLGAGGAFAVSGGDPAVALLVGLPLSFAAARHGASAVLVGPARGQALLLLAPMAISAMILGSPLFWALAATAALQAAMAAALADSSATRAQEAAEAQAALAHEPLAGHTALPKAAADFQKLLGRDQITGLPNRHSFMHLLAQESARAFRAETALSLLLISWDDYDGTAVAARNDTMNLRIAGMARRLRGTLHRQQDILASLGGGRFAAVLPFTDAFGAKTVAENLQAALRAPVLDEHGNDAAAPAAISIGAATYCGKGLLPETQLLQFAEEALAAARKTGGDRISRYDPMVSTLRPPPYAGATAQPKSVSQSAEGLASVSK